MAKFFTLSEAAGLIRSNKFDEKEEAVLCASFRAEFRNVPIKIFEQDSTKPGEKKCILVANPDGTCKKPKGLGSDSEQIMGDDNSAAGIPNASAAHILLSSFADQPCTTFYLKSPVTETMVQDLEKETGVSIGLYDEQVLHAYTQESGQVRSIETALEGKKITIDRVAAAVQETIVTAGKKPHKMARAFQMPELSVKATSRFGGDFKHRAHCQPMPGSRETHAVLADGEKVGEAKNPKEASRMMKEAAMRAFEKFLNKEL